METGKPCAPPYDYKNQMPLTENVALFEVIIAIKLWLRQIKENSIIKQFTEQ